MTTARCLIAFTITLVFTIVAPVRGQAAIEPNLPMRIFLKGVDELGDVVLVVYKDGQFEDGILVDPKSPEVQEFGAVRLPQDLPDGPALSLLVVPRKLAEKSEFTPDPTWLRNSPPGVTRVIGIIHYYPVEKWMSSHTYTLSKTDAGMLELKLMYYPEILEPYSKEEAVTKRLEPEKSVPTPQLWFVGGVAVVVLALGALGWVLVRRNRTRILRD